MTESDLQVLMDGISQLGLSTDEAPIGTLCRYIDELALWNSQLGLVSSEGEVLIVRHILDSLSAVDAVRMEVRRLAAVHNDVVVGDLGSGAGLPGIPIACFATDQSWLLIERSGRRAGFLRNAIAATGLEKVTVVEEDLSQTQVKFHLALLRAFHPLSPDLVREVQSHLIAPCSILAFKGRRARIDEEIRGLAAIGSPAGAHEIDVIPLKVPFLDEERHLVRIRCA